MTGSRPCSVMKNMLSKGGLKFAKREPKIFCFCFAVWEPCMRKQKSLHYSLQVWFPPLPPLFFFFPFGQAADFILNFLNADARSVLCKWCIYRVSASCAGRSRDMQLMGLPRKLGGRVLECFSGEWRGSSESGMTPGRGWCLCACRRIAASRGGRKSGWPKGVCVLQGGGCTSVKIVFAAFKCCRCSFPRIRPWEKSNV